MNITAKKVIEGVGNRAAGWMNVSVKEIILVITIFVILPMEQEFKLENKT